MQYSRRRFMHNYAALAAATRFAPSGLAAASTLLLLPDDDGHPFYPVTVQWSPVPSGYGWHGGHGSLTAAKIRETIDNIRAHGFTALQAPLPLPPHAAVYALQYAQARGMVITYQAGSLELFDRDQPPPLSVYSPEYARAVQKKVRAALPALRALPRLYNAFCYMDEPFHAGPRSLGWNRYNRTAFRRRYGYELPRNLAAARRRPRVWLDALNFHTANFPHGWRQVYRAIKAIDSRFKVILTHDSHSGFGGGVDSNAKLAIDDVYYWGGDFADTFVFDIYPYMFYDFRYGECGKLRKPRLSQMHYAFAHMRNLTRAYGKELGFWFGTYNRRWFHGYMNAEQRDATWLEREMSLTAAAQGADFLISGYKIPQRAAHWKELGQGLRLLQRAMPGLRRAPRLPARACFLFPRTQYLQLQREYWNVGISFELFLRAFGELDLLHEEQVRQGGLSDYRLLVLFDVSLLPVDVARRIQEFVYAGGVVVADCVPQQDELRRPLKEMNELFGLKWARTGRIVRCGVWVPKTNKPFWMTPPNPDLEAQVHRARLRGAALGGHYDCDLISPRACEVVSAEVLLRTTSDLPALLSRRSGQGRVFYLAACLQDTYFQAYKQDEPETRAQLYDLLYRITQAAGVRARVRSDNPEIEAALRANRREAYLFVINHESRRPQVRIRLTDLPFRLNSILDLHTGQTVPWQDRGVGQQLSLEVDHGEAHILRLLAATG